MQKATLYNSVRHTFMIAFMMCVALSAYATERNWFDKHTKIVQDTVLQASHEAETVTMRTQMVKSAHPVTIKISGNSICVKSKYQQTLPIYSQNGIFYAAFRLMRGTNWLSGLPKGTYVINNKKITIP